MIRPLQPSKSLFAPGNTHFIALAIVLVIGARFHLVWWIPLLIYFLWLPFQGKALILLVGLIVFTPNTPTISNTCMVIETGRYHSVCEADDTYRLNKSFPVGSVLNLRAVPAKTSPPVLFGFDRTRYYQSQGIDMVLMDQGSTVLATQTTLYQLRDWFLHYLERFPQPSQSYLRALIAGDRSQLDEAFTDDLASLGIMHLFAISGLHVGLMVRMLEQGLRKLKVTSNVPIIIFLLLYFFITGFSTSVVRAGLMFMSYQLLKPYGYQPLDSISIAASVVLLLNPYVIYDIGFQLSYLVAIGLVVIPFQGGTVKQLFVVSVIAQLMTFPVQANLYRSVNLTASIINIVFVWFVSTIFVPMTFVEMVLQTPVYPDLIRFFILMVDAAKRIQIMVDLPYVPILFLALFFLALTTKKRFLYLFLIAVFLIRSPSQERVVYLNVGQGDATLFQLDRCNLLLDTGGNITQDIASNVLIPHLHGFGISHLDILAITHGDFDHVGAATSLVDQFEVRQIVVPKYFENETLATFLDHAKHKRIPIRYVVPGEELCGRFKVLGPDRLYEKSNDQSLVLSIILNHKVFYFMGDNEQMIHLDSDVYKLGHHGSKTSTSNENLALISPQVGIISVGVNPYGLPSQEVLNLTTGITIYRTDRDGSIVYDVTRDRFFTTLEYQTLIQGKRP